MNAHTVAICHNHIHDLFYSGISCGWEWGYQENISRDNLIALIEVDSRVDLFEWSLQDAN